MDRSAFGPSTSRATAGSSHAVKAGPPAPIEPIHPVEPSACESRSTIEISSAGSDLEAAEGRGLHHAEDAGVAHGLDEVEREVASPFGFVGAGGDLVEQGLRDLEVGECRSGHRRVLPIQMQHQIQWLVTDTTLWNEI